jgi:hypothetical protein
MTSCPRRRIGTPTSGIRKSELSAVPRAGLIELADRDRDGALTLLRMVLKPIKEPEKRIAWFRTYCPKTYRLLAASRNWEELSDLEDG